ncbi:MAG: hypothetical protein WC729_05135 [Sphingomonas sp.]|jgi:hypothetical protein|uniref:hypothetical protein n=1 Tax=Sphingomonas sp. TaxID=28214 RepID=UPI0035676847
MSDPDLVKQAWQASAADPALPDLASVRAGADRFYRRVRRRNAVEYAAAVFVVIAFSAYVVILPLLTMRVGAAMVVLGTLFVVRQLHRLASATPPPERAAAEPILVHQRAQLARQRDALAGVFTWYLLPLIPGFVVMTLGPMLERGGAAGLLHIPRATWIVLISAAVAFTGVWLLNQRGAARLGTQIDDIDALVGGKE